MKFKQLFDRQKKRSKKIAKATQIAPESGLKAVYRPQSSKKRRYLILSLVTLIIVSGLIYLVANRSQQTGQIEITVERDEEYYQNWDECDDESTKPLVCYAKASYPLSELTNWHNDITDCWIALEDRGETDLVVYDISLRESYDDSDNYVHPASSSIYSSCGQNATDRFKQDGAPHPDKRFIVGKIITPPSESDIEDPQTNQDEAN